MPRVKLDITISPASLAKFKDLPLRAQRNLRRLIVTELGPELELIVKEMVAASPPRTNETFVFASDQSRKFYFWLLYNDPNLSQNGHWARGGEGSIEDAWTVHVSDTLQETMIRVRNDRRKVKGISQGEYPAQYLFRVPGHLNTGWLEWKWRMEDELRTVLRTRTMALWRQACREAWSSY